MIPARNAASLLRGQLAALAAQTYTGEWEVIVADNGSTDDTRQVVRDASLGGAAVRLVDASGRVASNRARNIGAAAARGEFVLFVDADDEVAPTWLDAMARAASRCDAVGGCLERVRLNTARDVRPGRELSSHLQVWPGFLPYANGANCGLRRSLFGELGLFDKGPRSADARALEPTQVLVLEYEAVRQAIQAEPVDS